VRVFVGGEDDAGTDGFGRYGSSLMRVEVGQISKINKKESRFERVFTI
jgi:hypothetical protein